MVPERWSLARGKCTYFLLPDITYLKRHLRSNSGNSDTIDLHGTTAAEAIVIVKEILNSEASSISQGKLCVSSISGQYSGLFLICCHLHHVSSSISPSSLSWWLLSFLPESLLSHVLAVLTNLKQNH